MQISERRKKILENIHEKGPLSYKEILDTMSEFADPVDILSDLDTMVFFKFLQHTKSYRKSGFEITAQLSLRPKTGKQLKDNPQRIISRLRDIEHEFPPWYRKLAILAVFDQGMELDKIFEAICDQYPYVKWSRTLVESSLRILTEAGYVCAEKQEKTEWYSLTFNGKSLLVKSPFQQLVSLRKLKDEFTNEFRTYEILTLVKEHKESGISSGRIVRHLQSEYGIRGNKRRAIGITLNNMVFSGLLRVIGGTEKRGGHVYSLGKTVEHLFSVEGEVVHYKPHIVRFKETVEQFFENYKTGIKRDIQSTVIKIFEDLEQCRGDLSLRSTTLWEGHIALLSGYIQDRKVDTWEKKMFQCIVVCILSRLLPPETSIEMLKDYHPPFPVSESEYLYYNGVTREYYSNLTEAYLSLGKNEEAFQSFDHLSLLSWESFEFLILKGTIEMKKGNMHKALDIFEKALRISRGEEKIVALFHTGLAYYRRGYFEEAKKTWNRCLSLRCTFNQKITLHYNLASVYRLLGEFEKAKESYEYCIALVGSAPEREESRFRSLIGLANVLIDLCSWDKAEKILREIIQECTEKLLPVAAMAKTNLGVLLSKKEEYEEALACHKEALELVDRECNPQEYGIILHNMGNALRQLKMLDDGLAVLKEALELIGDENMWLVQTIEISLADLYIDIGDFEESWKLSQSVLQDRWLDNRRGEAEAWRIQGKILLRKNEFKRARETLMRSEEIFKEYELCYELISVLQLLEECCRALEDEKQVAHYRNQRKNITQKIELPK